MPVTWISGSTAEQFHPYPSTYYFPHSAELTQPQGICKSRIPDFSAPRTAGETKRVPSLNKPWCPEDTSLRVLLVLFPIENPLGDVHRPYPKANYTPAIQTPIPTPADPTAANPTPAYPTATNPTASSPTQALPTQANHSQTDVATTNQEVLKYEIKPGNFVKEVETTSAPERRKGKNVMADRSDTTNGRGQTVTTRIMRWFAHPKGRYLKLSFRNKNTSSNIGIKETDGSETKNDGQDCQESEKRGDKVKVVATNMPMNRTGRNVTSRAIRGVRRRLRKLFK